MIIFRMYHKPTLVLQEILTSRLPANLYGDATLASYIDAANGGGVLIAGQTLVVPQLISVHNKAGMARPYYQLLQIIRGSLTPHLDTPQPPPQDDDDDFFDFLVKAIVVVVICVAAPVVAPEFVASLTATFGTTGALAVGAGLADAAAQGLCIGLGMQNNFSFAEVATTMITVGFGAQLAPLAAGATSAEWMAFIVKAGMVNVEEQLAEMAIGIRQQFDLDGVALAMGSAGLSAKINIDNPLERRLVADVGTAVMSGVVRGRFDAESLAAQMITDTAGYVAQQMQTKPVSDEYHQSKKASRGEGHITQTTVDQQWDSQLINDAEFTAHTPLPSVTFDVNNSYVSQQLGQRVGEEVSRFQHVDPPRNPNGFWQRVEQRYESVFEHRALIAEGRASANSEVMRESVGHAAANEQNYLDLGYTESNAQYGAGWIAAAELPLRSAAKGIMQTASLMNRRGFFGRNNTLDSTELSLPSLSKHALENWSTEQVIDYADQLGLKTPQNQLILWSGLGRSGAGIRLSQEYAAINGGITLEMTQGGKWLDELDLFGMDSPFSRIEARQIWANVSTRMIQQASGQVRSLVGTINPSSIYRAEQTEILMNEKILGLDELNLKPRFIFGNY